ncbi:aggrecan core protein-like isoform X2 [Dreissena polymorpha]|uniref:aggrecan core protein-like isoform X2 n=1 Tax=Dreissena polymorpha TaxID=45954 RepID=UPI002264602B|nr:aggrecan core protein-like isoform X2 [Dreissena polymorpha]
MQFKHTICLYVVNVLTGLSLPVQADYRCVCSVDGAIPVFQQADVFHGMVGFLFENFCKQYLYPVDANWNAVVFMHQVGFVLTNVSILQMCRLSPADASLALLSTDVGTMSTKDSQTSIHTTLTKASTANKVTSTAPTTTKIEIAISTMTTPWTTESWPTTPITSITNNASPTTSLSTLYTTGQLQPTHAPEGRVELCPYHVKNEVNIFGGSLDQYGDYCLQLVNVQKQWHNAQRHCTVAGHGRLVEIEDLKKQDFVVRFLAKYAQIQSIWLGLTDSETEGATAEGQWSWASGAPVSFTNFGANYNGHSSAAHKLNACVIIKQGGEWTDVQCGVALMMGTGFGESHYFMCQYNVTSMHLNILNELGTALVG